MEFSEFLTVEYLASFAGMVVGVVILTQFTKNLFDKLFAKLKTKWVTWIWAVIAWVVLVAITTNFSSMDTPQIVQFIFVGFINTIIVSFTARKSYEEATELLSKE